MFVGGISRDFVQNIKNLIEIHVNRYEILASSVARHMAMIILVNL